MNELRRKIEAEIRRSGPIPFSQYMDMCLYDREFGYYSRNAAQFGKAGDFYTSSDIHAVFGRLLARQFEEMWRVMDSPERVTLLELGPGRGLFARDVLDWSEKKFPDFFRASQYVLAEKSPALCRRIAENLPKRHLESGKATLRAAGSEGLSIQDLIAATPDSRVQSNPNQTNPTQANPTIVFANEFFDAMPVEILSTEGSLRIDAREGRFVETWTQTRDAEVEFLDRYSIHPEPGERVEVPLAAMVQMRALTMMKQGFMVVIDYGYTREEQLAGRHRGTVKAIRQHSVSANPYEAPGEQDITADVNFTALAKAAESQGCDVHKLLTQSQLLMGIGEANQFADAFEDCRLPQERAKVALQLKHLVTPAGMGESFQVLVASKGVELERVSKLAGLGFGGR